MSIIGNENPLVIGSSALPTGAATESTLSTVSSSLADIKTAIELLDNTVSGSELQVDVVTLPLPTNAATAANQTTANGYLTDIKGYLDGVEGLLTTIDSDTSLMVPDIDAIRVSIAAVEAALASNAGDQLRVDIISIPNVTFTNSSITANLGTLNGAATSAKQDTIIGHVDGIEGLLTTMDADTSALAGTVSSGRLQVDVKSITDGAGSLTVDGTVTANLSATDNAVLDTIATDTTALKTALDATNDRINVAVATSALPTGAATSANQSTINTSITSTNTKLDTVNSNLTTINTNIDGVEELLTTIDADTGTLAAAVTSNKVQVDVKTLPDVTIANAVLPISDNGGSITVDGTVSAAQSGTWTVNLGATDNGVLDAISSKLTTIDGHVDAVEGYLDGVEGLLTTIDADTGAIKLDTAAIRTAVDETNDRVKTAVVASLPAGNNNIGNVDIASALPAGTNNIGNVGQSGAWTVEVTQATAADLNATVTGTVELGASSLAALENISITIPGTVDLGNVSLTALETITVEQTDPTKMKPLIQGSVTTSAPTYTTGTNNALSLTTAGALRTAVTSSVLPTGAATSANQTTIIGHVDGIETTLGTIDTSLNNIESYTNSIKTAVETIDNAIAGSEMQVDIVTMPSISGTVTANLSATDNAVLDNIDTSLNAIEADTAAIRTAVDETNDRVKVSLDASSATVNVADGGGSLTVDGTVSLSSATLTALETINAAQSGTWNVGLNAGTNTIGKLGANSGVDIGDVTINNSSIPVTQSGTWTVNLGSTDNTVLDTISSTLTNIAGYTDGLEIVLSTIDADTSILAGAVSSGQMQVDVVASLPAGSNTIGNVGVAGSVTVVDGGGSITVDGTVALSGVTRNAGTTDSSTVRVVEAGASTSAVTSVTSTTSSVTLKAANASRRGLIIFNNSTSILYVKLGATASASSFTVKMQPDDYYEVPGWYNGVVDGIWSTANGAALITEID